MNKLESTKESTGTSSDCGKPVVSGWVAVAETLPSVGQWLLVFAKESGRHIAWYNGYQWEDREDYNITGVSHWMSIPEPPFR